MAESGLLQRFAKSPVEVTPLPLGSNPSVSAKTIMIHFTVNDKSDHWAVGISSNHKDLLLQVQEEGNQARIVLPVSHAEMLILKLQNCIYKLNVGQK